MDGREGMKRAAARAALAEVQPGMLLGVGTGSTAAAFVAELAAAGVPLAGTVPSSLATGRLLAAAGLRVVEPGTVAELELYVDGADEADTQLRLIKGGGGALTREKALASIAARFVCIVDDSKESTRLGSFPLAVEVLPCALAAVERALRALGGDPRRRPGFATDNGNAILDVTGLDFADPEALERTIGDIAGVVADGIFARRPADLLIVGASDGSVRRLVRS